MNSSNESKGHSLDPYTEWRQTTFNHGTDRELHPNLTQDKLAARLRSIESVGADPTKFTDPTDRMAATLAKAQRITYSEWYKKLPDNYKKLVKESYYLAYVVPGYKDSGLPVPDKDTWVNNIDRPRSHSIYSAVDPASYYEPLGWKHYDHYTYSILGNVGSIFRGMSHAGVWSAKNNALVALKLDKFFHLPNPDNLSEEDIKNFGEYEQKQVDNISSHIFGNIDFWNQTHPSQSLGEKAASLTGEIIVQLPLYGAIEEGLAGAAKLLPEAAKVATGMAEGPAQKGLQNLTKTLLTSAKGKFISDRLSEGASGYLGSVLQNGSAKDNFYSALAFMGFGTGIAGAGKVLKVGSDVLAKKLAANNLVIGGRPFQEVITNEAAHEIDNGLLGTDHLGVDIRLVPNPDGSGTIHYGDIQQIPYKNLEELQTKITPLIRNVQLNDPTRFDLLTAEKGVLNSISLVQFGKTYSQLSKAEKAATRIVRAQQVNDAVNELPLHVPDIAKSHIEEDLAQQRKENPIFDQNVSNIEKKYGIKVSSELQEAEAEKVAQETGVKNPQQAAKRSAKAKVDFDKAEAKLREEQPRHYVQFKVNNLAYLRNPITKGTVRGIKSTSRVNDFDYKTWLEDMSDKDFDKEVWDHTGNKFFFENPEHAMLWAYQYRAQMPKPFAQRIEDRLHELIPNVTNPQLMNASKNMDRHLEKLADTGLLTSEGNVYRSSNFFGDWSNRTKWQKELNKDLDRKELLEFKFVTKSLKNSSPIAIQTAEAALKNLQTLRRAATSAGEDLKVSNRIKKLMSGLQ